MRVSGARQKRQRTHDPALVAVDLAFAQGQRVLAGGLATIPVHGQRHGLRRVQPTFEARWRAWPGWRRWRASGPPAISDPARNRQGWPPRASTPRVASSPTRDLRAAGLRAEIQRPRRGRVGRQGFDVAEVAGEAVQHVLPGPGRLGVAQHHLLAGAGGADDVGHQPVAGEVAAADDVAAARGAHGHAGEEAAGEALHHDLGGGLGGRIGILAAEVVALDEGARRSRGWRRPCPR